MILGPPQACEQEEGLIGWHKRVHTLVPEYAEYSHPSLPKGDVMRTLREAQEYQVVLYQQLGTYVKVKRRTRKPPLGPHPEGKWRTIVGPARQGGLRVRLWNGGIEVRPLKDVLSEPGAKGPLARGGPLSRRGIVKKRVYGR